MTTKRRFGHCCVKFPRPDNELLCLAKLGTRDACDVTEPILSNAMAILNSVPSGREEGRLAVRLSLGFHAQTGPARARAFLGSGIPIHVGTFPTMDVRQAAAASAWHNGSRNFTPGFICVNAGNSRQSKNRFPQVSPADSSPRKARARRPRAPFASVSAPPSRRERRVRPAGERCGDV